MRTDVVNPDSRQIVHKPNSEIDPASGSADILPVDAHLTTEFEAWDAASDEALSNFEVSLE